MVRSPVGHLPAGVFQQEAELVVTSLGVVRFPRGGSQPHIIVETFRHRLGRPGRLARPVVSRDSHSHGVQFSYPAVDEKLAGFAELATGALLGACLEDPAIAFYFVHEGPAFGNCQSQRLFAVDILAGTNCGDGRRDMPVIGRRDRDRVDIISGQHLAEIVIARLRVEPYPIAGTFSVGCVDITYSHHLAAGLRMESPHIAAALTSGADAADRDAVARGIGAENR